jgi:NADPH-dependent curcumin reductase CurA
MNHDIALDAGRANRQVWLKSRPNGIPRAEDFAIRTAPVPTLKEGELLVRNAYLSVDPAMRGWIADKSTYWPRIEVGDTMRAFAVGEVIESRHPDYAVGDPVMGIFGWQDYSAVRPENVMRKLREPDLPMSLSLGVLGLNGLTAYFGLLDVCRAGAGATLVVSTAAGAVGSAAGQIGRIQGCRVVGIAGGAEKVRQCMEEFGFHAAIDYKRERDLEAALRQACPNGIDAYFDNTSGAALDAVLRQINVHARIAICELGSVEHGPASGTPPARETRHDARFPDHGLHRPLRGGRGRAGGLGPCRSAEVPRGHPRGHGVCARAHRDPVHRRQQRQVARPPAGGRGTAAFFPMRSTCRD